MQSAKSGSTAVAEDVQAVTGVMRQFAHAVQNFDADAMATLWDEEADLLVYQAEEMDRALHDIPEIHRYISNLPNVIDGLLDTRVIESKVTVVGEHAHSYVRFWCRIARRGHEPLDGQVRQTFLMRRRADTWSLVQYHESRQVPGFETLPRAEGERA